ncbi:MAG: mechanosensitive ion channel family protein [Actinobacteria bacterium]|nr:mechanosensitive ion channel family protein [Actinomycetota bacterium]
MTHRPSWLVGRLAFWALFLGVIALAVSVLGINALTDFVAAIFAYLPNVIAAVLIFVVAGAIAAGVAALVARTMGDTPTGKVIASVVPILIMAIAGFMILDQLKIAEDIVMITYAALIGAIALGLALAFGLGGRDVAARMLEGAYQKGQENSEQVKRDIQKGKEQTKQDVSRAKEKAQDGAEGDTISGPPARPGRAPATTGVGASTATPTARGDRDDSGSTEKIEVVPADELGSVPPGSPDPEGTRRRY